MISTQRTILLTGLASGVTGLVATLTFLFAPLRTVYVASGEVTQPQQVSTLDFFGLGGALLWGSVLLCLLLLLGIVAGALWHVRSQTTGGAVLLWTEHEFVFATQAGDPTPFETVRRALDRALRHAGLPHIHFHDLRHTAATLLVADNINPQVVSELLGHTSVSITLDRYSHVLPSMQQGAAAAMDRLLG
jgi:uncharacterized membrane protein